MLQNINILIFPAHCMHVLQLFDQGVASSLKKLEQYDTVGAIDISTIKYYRPLDKNQ